MEIQNKYNIEDEVYLKTDPDQLLRIVTSIMIKPGKNLMYQLSCGQEVSDHYECEICKDRNMVIKTQ